MASYTYNNVGCVTLDVQTDINAGSSAYAPVLYFDTNLEGAGTIRAGNLTCPMWNQGVNIELNTGTDEMILTDMSAGTPDSPLGNFTYLAGTFTSALDGTGEVTLMGATSTIDGQAIISFWKNGVKVRSFYTPPPVTTVTALTYPINFSHPLAMGVGDTFYITRSKVSGGSVELLGVDVDANAQTTVQFKFLGH